MKLLTNYFRNFRSVNRRIVQLLVKQDRKVVLEILDYTYKSNGAFMFAELQIKCAKAFFLSVNKTMIPVLTDQKIIRLSIPVKDQTRVRIKAIGVFNGVKKKFNLNGSGFIMSPPFNGHLVNDTDTSLNDVRFAYNMESIVISDSQVKAIESIIYKDSLAFDMDSNFSFNLDTSQILNELNNSTTHEK